MRNKSYIAIDLKSFYASVECVERGLDPLKTNLVVADESKTEKTICLAVSPSLKSFKIPGRARLFEVVSKVDIVNKRRLENTSSGNFVGASVNIDELNCNPELELKYITAPPRMAHYIDYSTRIYDIYLKYIAPEDIHVYSIDEVFIDATGYLDIYRMDAEALAMKMIKDVYLSTGITATAGIGSNMYLAKIAMDVVAKHALPDENGVRMGKLDEMSYRRMLWNHRPLTDFWRVGRGTMDKLAKYGMFTMGDVARCSLDDEELLYKIFGVNAGLLIDHAWGYEPTTIADVKAYKPDNSSFSFGQVLTKPYDYEHARIVVYEMADGASLDLVEKGMLTNQLTLTVGYDRECLDNPDIRTKYKGEIVRDRYGRLIPKHTHGTVNLKGYTSSPSEIVEAILKLYDDIVNSILLIRRITISTNNVIFEEDYEPEPVCEQMSLFDFMDNSKQTDNISKQEKERSLQEACLSIKKKYGKNAILKGVSLTEGATARDRNAQIGGHKA